jgi:hypothetical protein
MRAFLVISLLLGVALNWMLALTSENLSGEVLSPTGDHFYSVALPWMTVVAAFHLPSGFRAIAVVAFVLGLLGYWRRLNVSALTFAAVVLFLVDIVGVVFFLWRLGLFSASLHAHAA